MSDPSGENSEQTPDPSKKDQVNRAKEALRRNLNNFLNPAFQLKPGQAPDPNGAAQLRMAQMELANRMRLQQKQSKGDDKDKPKPKPKKAPPPGFGASHGVFQLQRPNFGQGKSPKPSASKPSPYQQIFAAAHQTDEEKPQEKEVRTGDQGEEFLEVPEEAEFKQNEKPKRLKGKKFRNPSL